MIIAYTQSMDVFYNNFYELMQHQRPHIRRSLLDEIDDSARYIYIRGTRGIGKTSFLLDYASEKFPTMGRECIYINLNHFCFSQNTIYDFAKQFIAEGGRILLIEQIFKYTGWEEQLEKCYRDFPELRIIFTSSSVMTIDSPLLQKVVKTYELRGFSFREYFCHKHDLHLPAVSLRELLRNHDDIAAEVLSQHPVQDDFEQYLRTGYYPIVQEASLFVEELVKVMNMTLEVDVIYIRQIDPSYLLKLRQLLFLVASEMGSINISRLSKHIGVSRATVMNYLKYLSDARMISTVYKSGEEYPKKPHEIYLQNTNIAQAFYPVRLSQEELFKIFFVNQLSAHHAVNASGSHNADFIIDDTHLFRLLNTHGRSTREDVLFVVNQLQSRKRNHIPLWLFGFLY